MTDARYSFYFRLSMIGLAVGTVLWLLYRADQGDTFAAAALGGIGVLVVMIVALVIFTWINAKAQRSYGNAPASNDQTIKQIRDTAAALAAQNRDLTKRLGDAPKVYDTATGQAGAVTPQNTYFEMDDIETLAKNLGMPGQSDGEVTYEYSNDT